MLRTFESYRPKIHPAAFVHDSAEIIGRVTIGARASIWPLAVLRGDVDRIVIGERSNVQDLCVVHCRDNAPTIVGKGVTVGHHVVLHGARIGDQCLIGMGAVVMEARLGARCLVGAGALILAGAKFPAGRLILGSPARAVRPLTAAELKSLAQSEANYLRYMEQHRATSRPA